MKLLNSIIITVLVSIFSLIGCSDNDIDTGTTTIGNALIYPFANGMPKFTNVTFKVENEAIDLYSVRANNIYTWGELVGDNLTSRIGVAMFDMKGPVNIEITFPSTPSNVIIRPIISGITPTISGNKITFTITEANQYSVEYNNTSINNPANSILVFANQNETFRGSIVRQAGIYKENISVGANQTLYLKPGAVIRGSVTLTGNNSKVIGRGIIDGSIFTNWINDGWRPVLPININGRNNVEITGITIFDSNAWNVEIRNSTNVNISNLKIVSSRSNSDGISIQSSNNINIENCFIRSWDDGIVIKNYDKAMNSHTIIAKNVRMWIDLAQALEIGYETNKGDNGNNPNPKIYNVLFEDINILHALHKAPISVHNGDNAVITDIIFKNITIENYYTGQGDGWNYLIDITNATATELEGTPSWTTVEARGSISGLLIENVNVLGGRNPTINVNERSGFRFLNGSAGGTISATVKNIFYMGIPLEYSTTNTGVTLTWENNINVGGEVVTAQWSSWNTFDDSSEGGTSNINLSETNGVFSISGNITNDATYVGYVGWTFEPNNATLNALRTATSISFKITGDGKTYRLILPTSDITDYCYYSASFSTTFDTETIITVYLGNFTQPNWGVQKAFNKPLIQNVQFQTSDGDLGYFNLTINDLKINK